MGCASTPLTGEGARVGVTHRPVEGCQLIGELREAEGGNFRSLRDNLRSVRSMLRNRAAGLGGDTVLVVSTETDPYHMPSGVPGLMTPNPPCSNCVTMTARVYACGGAPRVTPRIAPSPAEGGACPPAAPEAADDEDEALVDE